MPRIVRIINRLNLGGPTFNAALLTKHLAPKYKTDLLAGNKLLTEESSEYIVNSLGISPILVPKMNRSIHLMNDLKAYKFIYNYIRKTKPDIVHTHASKAGLLGRVAAHRLNIPIIVHTFHGHTFHSYFNKVKSNAIVLMERRLAKVSNKIIAISANQKDELSNTYKIADSAKFKIIPLGFDLSKFTTNQNSKRTKFRNKYNISETQIAIAIVGRLVPIKNHIFFLNAIKSVLKNSTKDIRVFIVGDGQERDNLETTARNLNIPFTTEKEKFHNKPLCFTSWIKDIDEVNAGIDIAALTSLNEGTPVSLIEAMASGTPIVSTNVGGISDIVKNGYQGLLSNSDDLDSYIRNLTFLIENDDKRAAMSDMGLEDANRKFSYQNLVRNVDELYSELLNNHN